jgi:hypothetical protein
VRALGVVLLAVLLAEGLCFQAVAEDLAVQEICTERSACAFDLTVLPRRAGSDKPSLDLQVSQMISHRFGDELGFTVASNEGQCTSLGDQSVEYASHVAAGDGTIHLKGRTLTGVFVENQHPLQPLAVFSRVEEEVVTPRWS